MIESMIELFGAARRVSVPIVAIRTADQFATVRAITEHSGKLPVVQWDAAAGVTPVNDEGKAELARAGIKADQTYGFVAAMEAALRLNGRSVICAHNAHRQLHSQEPGQVAGNIQAVANLRDRYKLNYRMLVLMGPAFTPPPELANDVVTLDHELPAPEELATMIKEVHEEGIRGAKAAGTAVTFKMPDKAALARAVDAVCGVPMFTAEQVTAMSLTPAGLDMDALWERKRQAIEQIPGLSVWRGAERFRDIVGLDAIKAHLANRLEARTPIGVVVWIDEIDKVLANVEADTSGVRMDQMRTVLVEMENNEWRGLVGVGVAGGGKSLIAKAFGNEAGVLTVALDLSGAESKWVGESESNLRQIMATVRAIGRGHAYVIATSNAASVMRPELQRRFTDGLWFFDLLTDAERVACWAFYMKRYELPAQPLPDDEGWTGAEIRNCCRYAWDVRSTILEAARFVVPMARSRADEIERLRTYAHGRFLDASHPGAYQYTSAPMAAQLRAITLAPGPGTLQ